MPSTFTPDQLKALSLIHGDDDCCEGCGTPEHKLWEPLEDGWCAECLEFSGPNEDELRRWERTW